MTSTFFNAVLLPLALAIIMLGLGLSLTLNDFKRVVSYPKAIVIGLVSQMFILPLVCFFIARFFGLSPELAPIRRTPLCSSLRAPRAKSSSP